MTVVYPLSAIVGQNALVEALLVNAVDPHVGGVLVRGERGTAKSTAVRGLAPLLPPVRAAVGEPYAFAPGELAPGGRIALDARAELRPAPLVELPLGSTLDRLVGSVDLGRALAGERAFEPGLLARAHQGILYVDEVNLLPDHLVDALLDAAASGVARIERDAVSVTHTARFLLVGTMNVEEGELRPQLLDRFGLGVEVRAPVEPAERSEIVRRRLAFDRDPQTFAAAWAQEEHRLAVRIAAARERLPRVVLPERELYRITSACAALGIDGVRGDIVCARAARALTAFDAVDTVCEQHVRRAARLALDHRRRRNSPDGDATVDQELERALDGDGPGDRPPEGGGSPDGSGGNGTVGDSASTLAAPARERRDPPAAALLPREALALADSGAGPSGRRARASGPSVGSIDSRSALPGSEDLAPVATLLHRLAHGRAAPMRQHIRSGREGVLLCFVVDASGSMGAHRRLARVKGALLALLREAHARRDRIAIIAFRHDEACVLVAPGTPLERAAEAVRALPTGGRTPLLAGMLSAERLIQREREREPGRRAVAVLITDGRVADADGEIRRAARRLGQAAAVHVVDTEEGPARVGLARTIAAAAGGGLHTLTTPTTRRRRAA